MAASIPVVLVLVLERTLVNEAVFAGARRVVDLLRFLVSASGLTQRSFRSQASSLTPQASPNSYAGEGVVADGEVGRLFG